ncbi:DUF3560 domain-containing protein [Candidatus Pacearchaeota archaeon]|nr:DUF3560 domain-containing protein [Candidatus Pacearchaeota archaeon]
MDLKDIQPDHRATYSPEDNKIRIYPAYRLEKEEYLVLKSAGFSWAPKQELFFTPRWTPSREDMAIRFCGEIGDEDTTLVDRAEERADRFENYSTKREAEANQEHDNVHEITKHIPLGQPILIGHHSEKRARKDQERIENGMRKAVKLWETSKYWEYRAAGALHHAKYKERPDVRARRIKKIEAENRKYKSRYIPPKKIIKTLDKPWNCPVCNEYSCKTHPEAEIKIPHVYMGRGNGWTAEKSLPGIKKSYERIIAHNKNRLIYEKAMLNEQGASNLLEKKARPKQLPLLNYRAPDGLQVQKMGYNPNNETEIYKQIEMNRAEFSKIYTDYKGTRIINNTHRVRITVSHKIGCYDRNIVFITDSKTHTPPAPDQVQGPKEERRPQEPLRPVATYYKPPEKNKFDDLKQRLKEGIITFTAPQLFPTPPDLAAKIVDYANIIPGDTILEPSAGTGALVKAMNEANSGGTVTTIEINQALSDALQPLSDNNICDDFLNCNGNLDKFDKIIMNPPFINGADIKHINHALQYLKPGGVLVAICANGPRQQKAFKDTADHWEDLPAGTFKNAGTNVNTALMVIYN